MSQATFEPEFFRRLLVVELAAGAERLLGADRDFAATEFRVERSFLFRGAGMTDVSSWEV
jgi:hypothetical protein